MSKEKHIDKYHGFIEFKRIGFHYNFACWVLPIGLQFSSSGLFIDVLCFTIIINR